MIVEQKIAQLEKLVQLYRGVAILGVLIGALIAELQFIMALL